MFQHPGLFRVRFIGCGYYYSYTLSGYLAACGTSAEAEMRGDEGHQMFYAVYCLFGGVLILL